MDANKMREQFEAKFPVPAGVAWKEAIEMYEVVEVWKLDQAITIGKYNWLWEGWQASREAVVVELPDYQFDETDRADGFNTCLRQSIEAVEALGLACEVAP